MTVWRKSWLILRFLGVRWAAFRLLYAVQTKLGVLARRAPRARWEDLPAVDALPAWLKAPPWPAGANEWGNRCIEDADGLSLGEFVLFSHHRKHLGVPPNWRQNTFTGQTAPAGLHWSQLGDFDFGDIKGIWEPSRFGWAFTLARAHARTGEARLAELFWTLFEDWCTQNPPNDGVNWKCGQESTFRLMAAAFAVGEFGRLPGATPARLALWGRFVAATGQRVEANLQYALHQSNNHGVSECVGLLTASLLAEAAPEAGSWRARGLRELESQLNALVYADGGFSQHSLMYQRVLLHDLLWAISVLRRANREVSGWLADKASSALHYLAELVDDATGGAPLFGANDGSNILPLDECAYDDLRGVVQAGFALLENRRVYAPGAHDEAVLWLTGRDPVSFPLQPLGREATWHAAESGIFQWHSGKARLVLRCPTHFLHRPGQADMLHADIWFGGRAVAHDSGTYSYNSPERFVGEFAKAAAHNVPMIEGREPLQKAGRFLYLPWPTGSAGWSGPGKVFRATHDAYGAEGRIARTVENPAAEVFAVKDKIELTNPAMVRLHWLLADGDWKLGADGASVSAAWGNGVCTFSWSTNGPAPKVSLLRADKSTARGWWSRYYLAVQPAVSLELLFDAKDVLEITTRFSWRAA